MKLPKSYADWQGERQIGHNLLLLTGKYAYIPKYGWTMDKHIESFMEDYTVVSHSMLEGQGVMSKYSVIMKRIPEVGD